MKHIKDIVSACLLAMASTAAIAAPVNINTATASELAAAIQGVGEKKAQAIVAYRDANGAFKSVDELANVKGIGAATVDKNRSDLLLQSASN